MGSGRAAQQQQQQRRQCSSSSSSSSGGRSIAAAAASGTRAHTQASCVGSSTGAHVGKWVHAAVGAHDGKGVGLAARSHVDRVDGTGAHVAGKCRRDESKSTDCQKEQTDTRAALYDASHDTRTRHTNDTHNARDPRSTTHTAHKRHAQCTQSTTHHATRGSTCMQAMDGRLARQTIATNAAVHARYTQRSARECMHAGGDGRQASERAEQAAHLKSSLPPALSVLLL